MAISRNRVWGTPIPIWINETTGNKKCISSIEELEKLTGAKVTDLHRENIDPLTFSIEGEEGTYQRIEEIFDCWFESGSMPYAQIHYPFENADTFDKGYPAEFIAEGLDQTRGWFYTLTILSTALFGKPAFKNVIVNGIVKAEDGKKMSKRLKNYTPPDDLMENFKADALRLYLITSGLVRAEDQRFSDSGVKDMVRRALLPWYNASKFFNTYAGVDGWTVTNNYQESQNITDRWILSRLQTLKSTISKEMESYHLYNVVPALFEFIEDLTNWYIRLNRNRFWGEGLSDDKCQAFSTLYRTLVELSQIMAPFAPFLSEHTFQELKSFGEELPLSVHLSDYPVAKLESADETLEDAMSRIQQIILLGRQKRNQISVKVKTPLRRLTVINKNQDLLSEIKKLESYIQSELNIKNIEYTTAEENFITLFAKPNSPVLGKKLGKEFGKFMGLIKNLKASELESLEENGTIEVEGKTFVSDEILIFREPKEGTETVSNRFISIDIDINLNEDLINEGIAREVVNRIQKSRKDSNFNVEDRISIELSGSEKILSIVSKYEEYIAKETLAISVATGEISHKNVSNHEIEGEKITLAMEQVNS